MVPIFALIVHLAIMYGSNSVPTKEADHPFSTFYCPLICNESFYAHLVILVGGCVGRDQTFKESEGPAHRLSTCTIGTFIINGATFRSQDHHQASARE